MTSAAERIAHSFNAYFSHWDVRIEPADVIIGRHGRVVEQPSPRWPRPGWHVRYCVDADTEGLPYLEFYATHRMTNDRHVFIWADGQGEHRETVEDDSPTEIDAAVVEQLRARGLYP
jgi:hypothetical protein